jgi:PAS domain S-box-containing protein
MFGTINNALRLVCFDVDLKTGKETCFGDWKGFCGYSAEVLSMQKEISYFLLIPEDHYLLNIIKEKTLNMSPGESTSVEVRIRRKDGTIIWAQDVCFISGQDENGEITHVTAVLQDITEVKNITANLFRKQEHLDVVAQISRLSYWDWDIEKDKLNVSYHFEKEYGYESGRIAKVGYYDRTRHDWPSSWIDILHPDDVYYTLKTTENYISGKTETFLMDVRMKKFDGQYLWVRVAGLNSARLEDGSPTQMIGGILNIDETKRAELEAREKTENLQRTKEHLDIIAEISHLV